MTYITEILVLFSGWQRCKYTYENVYNVNSHVFIITKTNIKTGWRLFKKNLILGFCMGAGQWH